MDILSILQRSDAPEALFAALSTRLSRPPGAEFFVLPPPDFDAGEEFRTALRDVGVAVLTPTVRLEDLGAIRDALATVVDSGLPSVFVFLFPEVWLLAESVRAHVTTVVGRDYVLVEDGWAWRIEPGKRGWRPHRGGVGTSRYDRTAPELLTVWIALADVKRDQACMHFVALDDDPSYPHDLASTAVPPNVVRPVPAREGTALVWNANVLHWGGECATTAAPRLSLSITLARADAAQALPIIERPTTLTLRERLDMIASQLLTYAEAETVAPSFTAWAKVNSTLRSAR